MPSVNLKQAFEFDALASEQWIDQSLTGIVAGAATVLDTTVGNAAPSLRSNGSATGWWYFTGNQWQAGKTFDYSLDVNINPDGTTTRNVVQIAFWTARGATPATTANGFVFRLDNSVNGSAGFYKVTNGALAAPLLARTATTGAGTGNSWVAVANNVWYRLRLWSTDGLNVNMTTIRLSDGVTILAGNTTSLSSSFDSTHPVGGWFGQTNNVLSSASGHRLDNIVLAGASRVYQKTFIAAATTTNIAQPVGHGAIPHMVTDVSTAQPITVSTSGFGYASEVDLAHPIQASVTSNNDLFANRIVLDNTDIVTLGVTNLSSFTTQAGEYLGTPPLVATAWYEWDVPTVDVPDHMTWSFSFWGEGSGGGAVARVYEDKGHSPPIAGDEVDFTQVLGDSGDVSLTITPVAGRTYFIQIGLLAGTGEATSDFKSSFVPAIELTPDEIDGDAVENDVWVDLEDESDVPSDVPAIEPDMSDIGIIRRVSETYPTPTIVNGRPDGWLPSSTVDVDWGRIGIAVGGVSITKVRGIRTELTSLMLQEPFGEGPAQLVVYGATEWDYGQVGFEWLEVENNVDISHFDATGTYVKTLWSGIVTSISYDGSAWNLDCDGAFAGVAGMLPHRPKLVEQERDWGRSMTYAMRRAGRAASRRKAITEVEFGIKTRDRGSRGETLLEYVTRGLGMCQTDDGGQWTLGRVPGIRRKYEWRLKERATVQVTVNARARGIKVDLRRDLSGINRLIMGEGVNTRGGRWRGVKLPNVGKETVPAWPGQNFGLGDSGDYVTVWKCEALSDGHRTGDLDALTGEIFTEDDVEACKDIQEDAGLSVTGVVNQATWNATWSNGDNDLNLGGARFDPIAADRRVIPFLYSSNGSVTLFNPVWDRSLIPIGRFVSYGADISKKRAKKSAKADLVREGEPSWYGTVTIDGVDPVEMSRLDIREGYNIRLKWFGGVSTGVVLHIAGVRWQRSGPAWSVSLDVDERARDLLSLAEIWNREREARQDPARLAIAQLRRSAQVRDTPAVWDSEGGFGVLPPRNADPGWNVFKIAAGQYGSLSRVKFKTSPNATFCVALFGSKVTKSFLHSVVPNPLIDANDAGYLPWDRPGIQDDLRDVLFIEAFGGFQQRGGFSPGYESNPNTGNLTDHPITGKLNIESSSSYGLADEPKMWVAFYNELDEVVEVSGQIFLLPNE